MPVNKPFFSIEVSCVGVMFQIRVNDVPVWITPNKAEMKLSFPINQWLKKGRNKISLIFDNDSYSPLAQCKTLTMFRYGGNNNNISVGKIEISNGLVRNADAVTYDQFEIIKDCIIVGDVTEVRDESKFIVAQELNIDMDYPKWNWFESDEIIYSDSLKKSLFLEYIKIHSMLKDKNIDLFHKIYFEKIDELSKAFYYSHVEMLRLSGLSDLSIYDDMYLYSLDELDYKIEIFGNNRLAMITRWNGKAQIAFVYNDDSSTIYYDFIFRLVSGRWILTR
jgi:hypothetical protein